MTTPSGTIKFSDIISEFGASPNKRLGEYRVSQSIAGRTWNLDTGVPSSGVIKFSDLKNKTLNVVVDYSGSDEFNINASSKYLSNGQIVGGYKNISQIESSSKKVYNIIRKTIGASTGDGIALRTGNWNNNTILNFIITSSGEIIGKGGNGGNGISANYGSGFGGSGSAGAGQNGSPAIGASYPCSIIIESGGRLQGGGGGGGGAGGAACNPDDNPQDPKAAGGGGGGGAGLPAGLGGGSSGTAGAGYSRGNGPIGQAGNKYSGGRGGDGDSTAGVQGPRDCAYGGGGGGGGGPTAGAAGTGAPGTCSGANGASGSSTSGGNGGNGGVCARGSYGSSNGASGGTNGFGVIYNPGVSVTINNSGGTYFGGSGQGVF